MSNFTSDFTQEPWSMNDAEQIVDCEGRIIAHMNDQYCNSGIEDQQEHLANAALIIKGPELLQSLEEICFLMKITPKILRESELLQEPYEKAIAVIESAKNSLAFR